MSTTATSSPKVARAIAATRRRDAIVRALRALWPPLMVLAGVGAFGAIMRDWPAALVSIIAGVGLAGAAWLLYRAITQFDPINDQEASARIEIKAGLQELAPLTTQDDRPIGGDRLLWDWQAKQRAAAADKLTVSVSPQLTRQDGLRAIALVLAVGICAWQPLAAARALSFDLSPLVGDSELVLDAWAQPPEYTGLPVVRLTRDTPNVSLLEGSIVHARIDGARGAPILRVPGKSIAMTSVRGQAWSAQVALTKSGDIVLDRLGARARWHVSAIKDRPPLLVSAAPIKIDAKGRLDVAFSATDDYGIASAVLRITPLDPPKSLARTRLFEAPIPFEGEADEEGARQVFINVSDHVLSGLPVSVVLVIRDGQGQETLSAPTRLIMPEVKWKTALGGALQEQRLLILREWRPYRSVVPAFATLFDPQSKEPIRLDLHEPLQGAPENIARAQELLSAMMSSLRDKGLSDVGMMAMRLAAEQLTLARSVEEAHKVAPILWQLARQAEIADQTPAQQRMAAAREALEQALKNGASDTEIAELTQELREAVGERLNELAQQGGSGEGSGDGGNSVSDSDIDKMLQELEQSGGSGARQEALDQLDKLAELMENLQSGGQGGGQGQEGSQSRGPNAVDDAMRQQRDLSDDTQERQNKDQGQNGSPEDPMGSGAGKPAPDLAQRQQDLADRLSPQGDQQSPSNGPEAQAQAGKANAAQAMREAVQALREGDLSAAREAQSRAEQALQQALQAQQAQGADGDGNQDPLGRSSQRQSDGHATKVPDQAEKRRARDVLEELRRRQADPNRDGQERDYLDRLLKDRQ